MRRKFIAWMVFVSVVALSTTASAQERVFKLKDGSEIKGEVVSKVGDVYKIKTSVLGIISVRDADVSLIEDPSLTNAASGPEEQSPSAALAILPGRMAAQKSALPVVPQASSDFRTYQQKITANPESMAAIEGLAKDKDTMDFLSDPEVRNALVSGNMEYLKNNEKFIKFINNPAVKKIMDAALGDQQGASHGGQDKNQPGK